MRLSPFLGKTKAAGRLDLTFRCLAFFRLGERAMLRESLRLGREAWGGDPPDTSHPGIYSALLDEGNIWTRALSGEEADGDFKAVEEKSRVGAGVGHQVRRMKRIEEKKLPVRILKGKRARS